MYILVSTSLNSLKLTYHSSKTSSMSLLFTTIQQWIGRDQEDHTVKASLKVWWKNLYLHSLNYRTMPRTQPNFSFIFLNHFSPRSKSPKCYLYLDFNFFKLFILKLNLYYLYKNSYYFLFSKMKNVLKVHLNFLEN